MLEGVLERPGVLAHLALIDQAGLVPVQELDRVLDGHDVIASVAVGEVDQRRQRRGLTGARRTVDTAEATRQHRGVADGRRDSKRLKRLNPVRNQPERRAERVALPIDVYAEA